MRSPQPENISEHQVIEAMGGHSHLQSRVTAAASKAGQGF